MSKSFDIINKRRKLFNSILPPLPESEISSLPNTCPVCGYPTLNSRALHEICQICFWEDSGIDDFNLNSNDIHHIQNLFDLHHYRQQVNENLQSFKTLLPTDDPEIAELKNKIHLLDKIESDLYLNSYLIELFLAELRSLKELLHHYRYKTFQKYNDLDK